MWAMIEKLRMCAWSTMPSLGYWRRRAPTLWPFSLQTRMAALRGAAGGTCSGEPLERLGEQAELAQNAAPGDADAEQAPEQRHRIDRLAPLPVPVLVLEVEPQRELAARQRRGDPEG